MTLSPIRDAKSGRLETPRRLVPVSPGTLNRETSKGARFAVSTLTSQVPVSESATRRRSLFEAASSSPVGMSKQALPSRRPTTMAPAMSRVVHRFVLLNTLWPLQSLVFSTINTAATDADERSLALEIHV